MTVVCLTWVGSPHEPDDPRFAALSPADEAALELALRHGRASGLPVTAVTAGPPDHERALRAALAVGADRAVRVDLPVGADSSSVAAALAATIDALGDTDTVWCGDYSANRGSGTVPGFVAARLGWAQALGLVGVARSDDGDLHVVRRLDGGRRERLSVRQRVVLSVEGSVARLRRAGLAATLAAERAEIEQRRFAVAHVVDERPVPYRPRARALPPPAGDSALARVRSITDVAAASGSRGETVYLAPDEAAARIAAALRRWGYLPDA